MNPVDVRYPAVEDRYLSALTECVLDLGRQYDVVALVVSGTIVRGQPDPNSDLDINLLHSGDFRVRVQEIHQGIPCEVFVNPPDRIRGYFEESRRTRRPPMAHMFATGFVMYDPYKIARRLVDEARRALADPPPVNDDELLRAKYGAATALEDAEDLVSRDPSAALLLLGHAVFLLVQTRLATEPGWLPRTKDFLDTLRATDPSAADLVDAATAGEVATRFDAARDLCQRVTGSTGFFAWKSIPEKA